MLRAIFFVTVLLFASTLVADESSKVDRAANIRVLQDNYRGLVQDLADVRLVCENLDAIEDDLRFALQDYASVWDLGFTEEEYLSALDAFAERHCSLKKSLGGPPIFRRSSFHTFDCVQRPRAIIKSP